MRRPFHAFETPAEALQAAAAGQIDAVVYDAPLLRYLLNHDYQTVLRVLPFKLLRQDYGIVLHQGSPWRERINRVLLKKIEGPTWEDILFRHLGE